MVHGIDNKIIENDTILSNTYALPNHKEIIYYMKIDYVERSN